MIYEYALEPELVATWTSPEVIAYYRNSFGADKGRVASRYPKKWSKRVWDAYEKATRGTVREIERLKFEEFVRELSQQFRRCHPPFDPKPKWLENAIREHARVPFRAILARTNPNNSSAVVVPQEIYAKNPAPLWAVNAAQKVDRKAAAMAEVFRDLLRCSSKIIFVDPYFDPAASRYSRPFAALLKSMMWKRPTSHPTEIKVIASSEKLRAKHFRTGCQKLSNKIPAGVTVGFQQISNKTSGEKIHNRYILTNLGGVFLGAGLDESNSPDDTDDISLMSLSQHAERWAQYAENLESNFEKEFDVISVKGTYVPRPR